MKTITIKEETWKKLTLIKIENQKRTIDEIIGELLDKKM